MQLPARSFRAPVSLAAWMALVLAGCQPVQEDRTVAWSGDGQDVGFQHGNEGVFVAGGDGHGLEKIYQPGPDVLATSTPLWSPIDRRLIFTTARDPNGNAAPLISQPAESNPEGEVQFQRPVIYTCWLRDEAEGEPRPLFEAACDHVGYVSANLAVRWRPRATSVFFLDQVGGGQALFEFDLATQAKQWVFPRAADAIVFDWAPDGEHLICGLGHHSADREADGLWIGSPEQSSWWHVPESELPPAARLGSLLERMRAARPAWSNDGRRFLFVSAAVAVQPATPGAVRVWTGNLVTREVELLAESDVPLSDLTWSPDGERLGMVRLADPPALQFLSLNGTISPLVGERPVRRFAGWDSSGRSLAYIAADDIAFSNDDNWALLLLADPAARDKLFVAPADGSRPGRQLISGLRVTFPRWSPTEAKLSLWFTFSPTHRSWLSRLLGLGLPHGDPAAVLDTATGNIDWLAVSPQEKAQIGHYHLSKHQYDEAWRWYEQAAAEWRHGAKPGTAAEYVRTLRSPEDMALFEYVCLRKLGRDDEADVRLRRFRETFPPEPPSFGLTGWIVDGRPLEDRIHELLAPGGLAESMLRDLYAAEVFLSVDAVDVGEDHIRREMVDGDNKERRLSAAIVLAQLLLLQDNRDEYVDLAVDAIVPSLPSVLPPSDLALDWQWLATHGLSALTGGLTLLPIVSEEFLEGVDEAPLARLAKACEALRRPDADPKAWWLDVALARIYGRLRQTDRQTEAIARLEVGPGASWVPHDEESKRRMAEVRKSLRELSRFEGWLAR